MLSRAFQGQFAPGSTWKPVMTVGALTHGFSPDTTLNCSSAVQIGNRAFHNHESAAYGPISLRPRARGLLQHLLLPGRHEARGRSTAPTRTTSTPRTRSCPRRRSSASASAAASTCPARRPAGSPTASGRSRTTTR
ncbi:penicillin-binding transpeptidase domain-containing protein [Nocardioides convexus]|uniref:penicillin-binding transpeptidase domain-containing protein n=1 Tax=Nocardioides convexus TaxID=2712224 RepID=UPI002418A41A|nr:penicillin-binding transpeptidase domain-containing protein [Nocardioides convexus]